MSIKKAVYDNQKVLQTNVNEEMYDDIQLGSVKGIKQMITIMRGCNNMCSFCVVPYTRGFEKNVPMEKIVREVEAMKSQGVKEILLLGQNVNSYFDDSC